MRRKGEKQEKSTEISRVLPGSRSLLLAKDRTRWCSIVLVESRSSICDFHSPYAPLINLSLFFLSYTFTPQAGVLGGVLLLHHHRGLRLRHPLLVRKRGGGKGERRGGFVSLFSKTCLVTHHSLPLPALALRIPFYYAFKLAFLVYLGYPGWNGATLIYNNFLKGLLQKYESAVDTHLDAAKVSATAAANDSQSSGETDIKKQN